MSAVQPARTSPPQLGMGVEGNMLCACLGGGSMGPQPASHLMLQPGMPSLSLELAVGLLNRVPLSKERSPARV